MHFLSTATICAFACLLIQTVSGSALGSVLKRHPDQECTISWQCTDPHEICVSHKCKKNVPCNKDDDCFFFAAADVANSYPHPKCYVLLHENIVPDGYGICVIYEKIKKLKPVARLSGSNADHLDTNHFRLPEQ